MTNSGLFLKGIALDHFNKAKDITWNWKVFWAGIEEVDL
jgi:hypothetical protein